MFIIIIVYIDSIVFIKKFPAVRVPFCHIQLISENIGKVLNVLGNVHQTVYIISESNVVCRFYKF